MEQVLFSPFFLFSSIYLIGAKAEISETDYQLNPKLRLLTDDKYIRGVLQTIKERLHVVSDVSKLAIPFFVEPTYDTPEALEMKGKLWNANLSSHVENLVSILTCFCFHCSFDRSRATANNTGG